MVIQGRENIEKAIKDWVPIINKKFGRNDFDENCIRWFNGMAESLTFEVYDDFYIVGGVWTDAYGDDSLHVASCGTIPSGGIGTFMKMQQRINEIAKIYGCRWIIQGSELDERYNRFLERRGYHACSFRKEVF